MQTFPPVVFIHALLSDGQLCVKCTSLWIMPSF